MTNDYGNNPLLSYNKYLRVPELIGLQDCLSDPEHHDELLFITIHQAYELWFKVILHEIDAAIQLMNADGAVAAERTLRRVVEIEKLLVNQIHILETMTPISFLGFREQLNPASGFQSMQFREIEFSSGLKDQSILHEFRNDNFAYERLRARFESLTLADAFYQLLRRRGLNAPPNDESLGQVPGVSTSRSAPGTRRVLFFVALAPHQDGRADGGRQTRHRRLGRHRLFAHHA